MPKNRLKLDEQLEVSYYEFSEDVICVEVTHQGRELGAFCSERSQFSEWTETDVKKLAENHVNQFLHSLKHDEQKTLKQLSTGVELEYYSHSDDLLCVNAFCNGKEVASLCTDRHSFTEWLEDETLLEKIIEKQRLN